MKNRKVWFWLMTISSCIYIMWRVLFTIPTDLGMISLVAGIMLLVAEMISTIEAEINFICMNHGDELELPTIAEEDYPDVDIVRNLLKEDIDKAIIYVLEFTLKKLTALDKPIHPDTLDAYNFLTLNSEEV